MIPTAQTAEGTDLLNRRGAQNRIATPADSLRPAQASTPDLAEALAVVPALILGIAALLKPGERTLPAWYRELVAARVASLNHCEDRAQAHARSAVELGAFAAQAAAFDGFENGPFTEREKAGFRYVDLLHRSSRAANGTAMNTMAFDDAGDFFTPAERIELTQIVAAYEFFPGLQRILAARSSTGR